MDFVCSPPPTCFSPSLHNLSSSKISSSIFLVPQTKICEVSPDKFFFYLSLAFSDIYTIHALYTIQNTIIRILLCLTTSTSTSDWGHCHCSPECLWVSYLCSMLLLLPPAHPLYLFLSFSYLVPSCVSARVSRAAGGWQPETSLLQLALAVMVLIELSGATESPAFWPFLCD